MDAERIELIEDLQRLCGGGVGEGYKTRIRTADKEKHNVYRMYVSKKPYSTFTRTSLYAGKRLPRQNLLLLRTLRNASST